MAQPQGEEHISKAITESQFLPPLQKRILLCLAENPPKSKYSLNKIINGHYKSVWNAFDSMQEKGIITEIKLEEYRGRDHQLFWLTTAGVYIALAEEANQKVLSNRILEIYPENRQLQCVVEMSSILGYEPFKMGYQAILAKGKIDKTDVSAIFGFLLLKETSMEQIKTLIEIVKKYPELFADFKEQTSQITANIKRVDSFLEDAFREDVGGK